MTHLRPEPDTNPILGEIHQHIYSNQEISEFLKLRYLQAAKKQISYERRYVIEALTYTAAKERMKAKDAIVKAFHLISDPATLSNGINILRINGFSSELVSHSQAMLERFIHDPEFFVCLGPYLLAFPNIRHCQMIKEQLENMQLIKEHRDMYKLCSAWVSVAEKANDIYGLDESVFGDISCLAAKIAQERSLVVNRASFSFHPETDWGSLVFCIETSDMSELVNLNLELGNSLVEKNWDTLPLVAHFEALDEGEEKAIEYYGD